MVLGPIEIVVIGFESGSFTGEIVAELEKLVEANTINIIDGLVVRKDSEEDTTFVELDQIDNDADVAKVAALMDKVDSLISDEDVEILADSLPVGGAAGILVFEHTWVKPLRDAIVNVGGELIDTIRVPGMVVQEVLDAIEALENEEN